MKNLSRLQIIWSIWKKFGEAIGDFVARLVLTVFYFTVLVPFGVGVQMFGDPLKLKRTTSDVRWQIRGKVEVSLDSFRRQF